MRRTEMLKTREVLRLKYEVGLSLRAIAQACNCGKSTVSEDPRSCTKVGSEMADRAK